MGLCDKGGGDEGLDVQGLRERRRSPSHTAAYLFQKILEWWTSKLKKVIVSDETSR